MEKYYNLIKKYALSAASQGYDLGKEAKIVIRTDDGIFGTKAMADFAHLRPEDIESFQLPKFPGEMRGMRAVIFSQTPFAMKYLNKYQLLKPTLDDAVRVVGTKIAMVDGRHGGHILAVGLAKALKKQSACFVITGRDKKEKLTGYTVSMGKSLYEAVLVMSLLEKTCCAEILGEKIGGTKPLSAMDSFRIRKLYKGKYAREEADAKEKETAQGIENLEEAETVNKAITSDTDVPYFSLAETLREYGNLAVEKGLVQGTSGNLSIRVDEENMLVTPSGRNYETLRAEDMVLININTLEHTGQIKPTSEKALHSEIYKARPDVRAVIHTHGTYSGVFAACESSPDEKLPLAKYALPGSDALAKNTASALDNGMGAIMSHHGMVACGADMDEAFKNAVYWEDQARYKLFAEA